MYQFGHAIWSQDAEVCANAYLKCAEEFDIDCIVTLIDLSVECDAETLKEYAAALCDAGADAIMFDTLFSSGTIMSKDMWREMEADAAAELAQVVHDKGAMVMIHNCGEKIYFDAQIEAMKPDAVSFLYPPDDCRDFVGPMVTPAARES